MKVHYGFGKKSMGTLDEKCWHTGAMY